MKKLLLSAILVFIVVIMISCEKSHEDEIISTTMENKNNTSENNINNSDIVDMLPNEIEYNALSASLEESEFYTYEEYIEFIESEKILWQSLIDCIDENWMPVSGHPVLTQEIYDEDWADFDVQSEEILNDIQNGKKIPKLPQHSFPYSCYDTLTENMNLMCDIDKYGKFVLYNPENCTPGYQIEEKFESKEDLLERSRWYLNRAVMAGEIDMAQANMVYKNLYNAGE